MKVESWRADSVEEMNIEKRDQKFARLMLVQRASDNIYTKLASAKEAPVNVLAKITGLYG